MRSARPPASSNTVASPPCPMRRTTSPRNRAGIRSVTAGADELYFAPGGCSMLDVGCWSPRLRLPASRLPLPASSLAEGVGFEPTDHLSAINRFQDGLLQPLGHPSVRGSLQSGVVSCQLSVISYQSSAVSRRS